jgi:LmbE family N-acetylglucosaminyl deacetylase
MVQKVQKSSPLDASPLDVYLQPHSDDICLSLGAFAYRRHRGILLTALAISAYVELRPGAPRPSQEWVTKTRRKEDRAFAKACGLDPRFLELQTASLLGYNPFNLGALDANLQRIKSPVLEALLAVPAGKPSAHRPWLFCPSAIGMHLDHVVIRTLITQNFEQLTQSYRIGFYEDLHYASSAADRSVGLSNLSQSLRGRQLHRYAFPLGEYESKKLALMQLYKSQFLTKPQSIAAYTPNFAPPNSPHEAIWSDEPKGPDLAT